MIKLLTQDYNPGVIHWSTAGMHADHVKSMSIITDAGQLCQYNTSLLSDSCRFNSVG